VSTTRLLAHLAALGGGGISDVPGFSALRDLGEVCDVREVWRRDVGEVDVAGSLLLAEEAAVSMGPLTLAIGTPGGGGASIPFAVTVDADLLEAILLARGVHLGLLDLGAVLDALEDRLDGVDLSDPDALATGLAALVADAVTALGDIRVSVGPVSARIDLPREWLRRVRPVTDAQGALLQLEEVPDAPPAWVPLGRVTLTVSAGGVDLDLDAAGSADLPVDVPPVAIADTGVAVAMADVVWHRDGPLPPGLTDHDLPPDWRGLIVGEVTLWGLDTLLPGAPADRADDVPGAAVTLTDWVVDHEGLRGRLSVSLPDTDDDASGFAVRRVELAFDRSWWPTELSLHAGLDLGAALGGEEHVIDVVADLHLDPTTTDPTQRWRVSLTATGGDDGPLVEIGPSGLVGAATAAAALAAASGEGDAALVLGALAALDAAGLGELTGLEIDHFGGLVRPALIATAAGERPARILELTVDARIVLELAPIDDDPMTVELGIGGVVASIVTGADPVDRPRVAVDWTLTDGLAVTLPTTIDLGGILVVEDVTLRRVPDGLAIEFGVSTSGSGDVAVAGLPDAVTVTYRPDGTPQVEVTLRRRAAPLSLLVPGVLYASGSLERVPAAANPFADDGHDWGDVLRGRLSAFLIGDGTASTPADHLRKDSYAFDLEIGVLSATREDGLQAFVLTLDAGFRPGLPLGASGASLYGLGLTFAMNGAPTVVNGDYAEWFFVTRPPYSTAVEKWRPEAGGWAFGASAVLGSAPDDGRSWNVGVGLFLLLPGPVVLITGKGDLFSALPSLPAQGGDPRALSFAFGAVLTLDFGRRFFGASLRGELKKSAGNATLVHATIPAEVSVDLDDPTTFTLAIGRPAPASERVQFEVLGLYEASSYLLLSGQDVILPGVTPPLTLPGLAFAFGAAGGLDRRLKAGPARVVLWARAGFDVGLSLSLPLAAGRVFVEGGIDVSLFGVGLSFEAALALAAMAPRPFVLTGSVEVRIDLPWPLPDFEASARLELAPRRDWVDHAPQPDPPVETLTLWGRGTGAPVVVEPGGSGADVPLDALAELSFPVPIGNTTTVLGSAATDGDDSAAPVWQVATTETDEDGFERQHGYRHTLTSVTITRRTDGSDVTEQGVPAFWPGGTATGAVDDLPPGVARTAGGMPARTSLRLWDLADPVAARVGGGGERVSRWVESWDPCTPPQLDEKQRLRIYTARSLASRLRTRSFVPPILLRPLWDLPHRRDLAGRLAERFAGVLDPNVGAELAGQLAAAADGALGRFDRLPRLMDLDVFRDRLDIVLDVEGRTFPLRDVPLPDAPPFGRPPFGRPPVQGDPPIERPPSRGRPPFGDGPPRGRPPFGGVPPGERPPDASLAALRQVVVSRLDLLGATSQRTERIGRLADDGRLPAWWTRRLATAPLPVGEVLVLPNDTPPDDEVARVRAEPLPSTAGVWGRTLGAEVEPPRIARNPASTDVALLTPIGPDDPVFALPRLTLPQPLPDTPTTLEPGAQSMVAQAVGRLRIDVTDTQRTTAILLVAPGVHVVAWRVDADGQEHPLSVDDTADVAIGDHRVWRRVRVTSHEPLVALLFAAVHGPLKVTRDDEAAVAVLTLVECSPPPRDVQGAYARHRDATDASVTVLRDVANTWDGSGDPAGVLVPATTYDVVVHGTTTAVTQGRTGLVGGTAYWDWQRTFRFTTTDRLTGGLRAHPDEAPHEGRVAAAGSRESDWDVATSPGEGALAHYTDTPLLVRLRDARTVAVADALDHELRLRLVDEHGEVTERLGGATFADATDLDSHLAVLRDRMAAFPCVADGRGGERWREARLDLPELLAPRTRYVAVLEAHPRGGGTPVQLHEWRFRTSAHTDAAAHLAAHVPVDELVPDEDGTRAQIGATAPSGLHVDDALFDTWLVDRLGVAATAAPTAPELVRIWAWDPATDAANCIALLLDGDEPLLRDPLPELTSGPVPVTLRRGGNVLAATVVTGVGAARVLVVPARPLPAGDVVVTVTSLAQSAELTVPVPAIPANLHMSP
jgi:hypothetical protein